MANQVYVVLCYKHKRFSFNIIIV